MEGSGSWAVEGLHDGPLLAARAAVIGLVVFWDWEQVKLSIG